jgi:UDP-4-amino-4-deoxy-L-arabinose-oxoglutarate aminotransferase
VISPGYKYNLADINAALALVQLGKLSEANARRREIAERYLPSWRIRRSSRCVFRPGRTSTPGTCLLFALMKPAAGSHATLMDALKAKGIGTGLHFRAAHTQKYYRERFPEVSLPNPNGTARVFVHSLFSRT